MLLLLHKSTHPFEHSWFMECIPINHLSYCLLRSLFILGRVEVRLSISLKLPDVDSIILSSCDHHSIIVWVEDCFQNGEGMSNEGLEVSR